MSILRLAATATPSPSPSPGAASTDQVSTTTDLKWLIALAVVVLAGFVAVYLVSTLRDNGRGLKALPTFSRIYSLLAVVFVAAALAFANVSDSSRSAAYAVLGAVAGYLAGQKNTTTTTVARHPGTEQPTVEAAPGQPPLEPTEAPGTTTYRTEGI